ncbi:hypothetical protein OESDEN_14748 [Oesophagostomum dentatum]|uniref:Uncharacterized protein n=1 Tax=Oesophagostomum dentatum TaxID=61180 RepID=A0A0B1SKS7_OESDE|nr:hypothetical protein OESDEN_14748 [Oesophagostomum dentatum]
MIRIRLPLPLQFYNCFLENGAYLYMHSKKEFDRNPALKSYQVGDYWEYHVPDPMWWTLRNFTLTAMEHFLNIIPYETEFGCARSANFTVFPGRSDAVQFDRLVCLFR